MLASALLAVALAVPQQDPAAAAAAEAKARADLGHAVQHVDEVLRLATETRDRVRMALDLAAATQATATQVDRARLAKLAGDLAAQLTSLEQAIATHAETLRAMRNDLAAEAPPPAAGGVAAFREAALAARRLSSYDATVAKLREVEKALQAVDVKTKPGASSLLAHVRYLQAEALRGQADDLRNRSQSQALLMFDESLKKLDQVLAAADATDTGEASSLHAAALRQKVEIHSKLFFAYRQKAQAEPGLRGKRDANRNAASSAYDRLTQQHGEATLPSGERVVDAALRTIERMRGD